MTINDKRVTAGLLACTLWTTAVQAQGGQGATAAGRAAARTIATRTTTSAARTAHALSQLGSGSAAAGSRATTVVGYLLAGEGVPVSNATVQLRNVVTGQIEQVGSTLPNGAFAFPNVAQGTYALEIVSDTAGKVVAVGQAFTVAPGETVATFVRLGTKLALLVPDLATNAAQAVIANATNAVATGIVSVAGTASPEQPASALK